MLPLKVTCEIVERRPFPSGYPIAASELSLGNLRMRIEEDGCMATVVLNLEGIGSPPHLKASGLGNLTNLEGIAKAGE